MMCERNPNLTGIGECDKENAYYAQLWLDGLWDMSKYVPESDYSKYNLSSEGLLSEDLTTEELRSRRVEAIRCCLGLTPDYKDNKIDKTRERFEGCRPGFNCPSSIGCGILFDRVMSGDWSEEEGGFDSYDFGSNYPENYSLEDSDDAKMENTGYYAKAYCQQMSGGRFPQDNIREKQGSVPAIGCGRSFAGEISCRKTIYNYCVEPVEMELQDSEVGGGVNSDIDKIRYPTRVFTDNCFNWCNLDSGELDIELPGQKGVCDMAVGKTCQQLQVDGWIDPTNWENSKILKFADKDGNWYEDGDETKIHNNLTAERLKNTCGCFLLGMNCGNNNCSLSYCGAGTDGNKGRGKVTLFDFKDYPEDNPSNFSTNNMKAIYDYDGPQSTDKWRSNVDNVGFDCIKTLDSGDEIGRCFDGCNYVNFNDTCWMASPDERRQNTVVQSGSEGFKNLNEWACQDKGEAIGDSCDPYNNSYGCFGYCNMGNYNQNNPEGNCGTPDWFDYKMGITPNEVDYKNKKDIYESNPALNNRKANSSIYWPKWQNFMLNGMTVDLL